MKGQWCMQGLPWDGLGGRCNWGEGSDTRSAEKHSVQPKQPLHAHLSDHGWVMKGQWSMHGGGPSRSLWRSSSDDAVTLSSDN